jgi:hypothetical protein
MVVIARIGVRCAAVAALIFAATNVPSLQAQERDRSARHPGMTHGVAPLLVLGHEAVQKDLALRPEQAEKVQELVAQVHAEWKAQMQAARGGDQGSANSSDDRRQRFGEMRSKRAEIFNNVNEKFRGKVAELLDPAQQTRLRQIAIQVAGTSAFHDAGVARELGLTAAQQEQLTAVHHEYAEKFAELRHEGRGQNGGESFSKMRELRQEELAKATGVLNPEQQARFATMKGKPFDLAQLHRSHGRHHAHTNNGEST